MTKVAIGIVGLGEVAQIIHLPALFALRDRYELAAFCDISPGVLNAVSDQYQVERRFLDANEMMKLPELDAVLVLGSDEYHADVAIAALNHGKHVLIEKPVCITLRELEEMIAARDRSGAQAMIGYMRRYAPAFVQAVEEVKKLEKINYVKVRDIIGRNLYFISQTSNIHRFNDLPEAAKADRAERAARLVKEAIGESSPEIVMAYRLLLGINSHDLPAMRELVGSPKRVVSANQWNGGRFFTATFEHDGYYSVLETGVDDQGRFDASIEVYSPTKTIIVDYDTPYVRHMPTTLIIQDTNGEDYTERVIRPTMVDPFTRELEAFHDAIQGKAPVKTTLEEARVDLQLFIDIVAAMKREA